MLKEICLRVYSYYNRLDCFWSKSRLERIYCGSEGANSAFILPQFYRSNKEYDIQFPSRSTTRHHHTRTLSNNLRTLSPAPREACLRNSLDTSFTLQNQTDCGQTGRQIHRYVGQFFLEPAFTQTIKIIRGNRPKVLNCAMDGYSPLFKHPKNPSQEIDLNKGLF